MRRPSFGIILAAPRPVARSARVINRGHRQILSRHIITGPVIILPTSGMALAKEIE
jgi:hypothetical protein